MSRPCPKYGVAIYLDCLDCEDKECRKVYESHLKGRPSCCGNCMYHKQREAKVQNAVKAEIANQIKGTEIVFRCSNPSSEYYGLNTEYYNNCIDFEDKADSKI